MSLLAVSIDCICNIEVQRCKESDFLGSGQIASGDLSASTHTHTDKCKISIMMIVCVVMRVHAFDVYNNQKDLHNIVHLESLLIPCATYTTTAYN